jgi:hypothetical protein
MEYKDLGNGRVIKQSTPRIAEPLPNSSVDPRSISSSIKSLFAGEAIVGSSGDVSSLRATHTSIQTAIDDVSNGARIFILPGTYVGNVVVNKRINLYGVGYDSILNGTLSFTTSVADYCILRDIQVTGNLTVSSSFCFLDFYLLNTATFADVGSSNSVRGITV